MTHIVSCCWRSQTPATKSTANWRMVVIMKTLWARATSEAIETRARELQHDISNCYTTHFARFAKRETALKSVSRSQAAHRFFDLLAQYQIETKKDHISSFQCVSHLVKGSCRRNSIVDSLEDSFEDRIPIGKIHLCSTLFFRIRQNAAEFRVWRVQWRKDLVLGETCPEIEGFAVRADWWVQCFARQCFAWNSSGSPSVSVIAIENLGISNCGRMTFSWHCKTIPCFASFIHSIASDTRAIAQSCVACIVIIA